MGFWNYRVCRENNELAIYSVYYDDESKIVGYSAEPAVIIGEDLEDIETNLKLMKDCLEKEIVDLDNL